MIGNAFVNAGKHNMKHFLILITLLTFSTIVSAQFNTTVDWVECQMKAGGVISCPRLERAKNVKALRVAHLDEIAKVKGTAFFVHLTGDCAIAFTAEDYDREKFIRQPSNLDCEDAPLYSVLRRRKK